MNIISCTDGMCEFYECFNLYYDFSTYECNCLGLGNPWLLSQIARSSWLPLLSLYTIFNFMIDVFLRKKNVELIINLIVLDKFRMVSVLSHHYTQTQCFTFILLSVHTTQLELLLSRCLLPRFSLIKFENSSFVLKAVSILFASSLFLKTALLRISTTCTIIKVCSKEDINKFK
ncbi:hypothetical protein V8G54_017995 [Vigna mungo]|uniref:Uncharacterized protein n=1 Tax=Vigna mungo TaxID=3915 RepID=A0AAQ3N7R0_VIGMU